MAGFPNALGVVAAVCILAGAGGAAAATPFGPRGIYVLDSQAGTNINGVPMRDANIRSLPFVAGYALRPSWETMEPHSNQYDFTIIDWNVRKLAAINRKLSLWVIMIEPEWLAETTNVVTWFDDDPRVNHLRAVPWDPFLLARMERFVHTLADHQIDGVPLRDHPVLEAVNFGVAGAKMAIRDPDAVHLRDMAGYTRTGFVSAVLANLRAAVSNFPATHVQTGFWPVTDAINTPRLWEDVRAAILAEFDGVQKPRVGFWMESLSASRPAPGAEPIDGRPITNWALPLYLSRNATWAGFQALTSWLRPFNNYGSQVTNATPADGMQYAFDAYGTRYVELYVSDIDHPGYRPAFDEWAARYAGDDWLSIAYGPAGTPVLRWFGRSGVQYSVQAGGTLSAWAPASPVLTGADAEIAWADAGATGMSARFYRLVTEQPATNWPGFVLSGTNWTYDDGELSMNGVFLMPAGTGMFPGIVISHGLGGSAAGFGLPKAREMAAWGAACIAPNYTHAAGETNTATYGASTENIRRAVKCVDILSGMPFVRPDAISAYGNSMGAFVTIALAAELTNRLAAAAITAGGVVTMPGYSAPTTGTAARVRSPFLILHGSADTTVPPDRSALLKEILDQGGVTNQRVVFEGVGHDLHQVRSNEVHQLIHEWFRSFGGLP